MGRALSGRLQPAASRVSGSARVVVEPVVSNHRGPDGALDERRPAGVGMIPADTNPRRPGRPVLSRTGERRRPWNVAIAPTARARVEAEAARQGVSPSALIEEWALSALAKPATTVVG